MMFKKITTPDLFLVAIVLSSLSFSPFILDQTLVPRFTGVWIGLALMLLSLCIKKPILSFRPDFILVCLFSYTLLQGLSVIWAINKAEAIFSFGKSMIAFLCFLSAVFFLKTNKERFMNLLLKFSVCLFYISSYFALWQFIGLSSFHREDLYQVTGINGHKNLFSSFMFLNLFFLFLAFSKLQGLWRYLSAGAIVLTLLLFIVLMTKAVLLGVLLSLLIFILFYVTQWHPLSKLSQQKTNSVAVALIILVTLSFSFLIPAVIQKSISKFKTAGEFIPGSVKLEEERLILWDKTYTIFHKKPLLGYGAGNWQIHLPDATLTGLWRGEELNYTYQRPHNDFLWILSETGILGFILFIGFLVLILFYLYKTLPLAVTKKLKFEPLLCLSFLTGYCCISFFDFPKERIEHTVWLSLILAISYDSITSSEFLRSSKEITISPLVSYLLLFLSLFFILCGTLRLKGEFYTRKMFDHKNRGVPQEVIKAGQHAESFVYTIDPTSVPIDWYVGNAEAMSGNYMKALLDFKKAQGFNPYNRNVLNDLGSAYVFENDVLGAKMCYEESARISPRFDDPKLNLASIYINAGDYKTAETWLKSLMHDSERRSNYQKMVDLALHK